MQSAVGFNDYARALRDGRLPVARGIALCADDRRRRAVIERLMCDRRVDLGTVAEFGPELDRLAALAADGLVDIAGPVVAVTERGRPFLRTICAVFDRYLAAESGRYSRAV